MEDYQKHLSIIATADGSQTLYNAFLDETYHSNKGALAESQHVFIDSGLSAFLATHDSCRILEVGFGTGLNAILAYHVATQSQKYVYYVGLEPYPLDLTLITKLGYELLLPSSLHKPFISLHQVAWQLSVAIDKFFTLEKTVAPLQHYEPSQTFDVVFFDAFAPKKQPELWQPEVFVRLYKMMSQNSILVSYCVSGHFKRALQTAGFQIEKLPGPKNGKREMLRASKK